MKKVDVLILVDTNGVNESDNLSHNVFIANNFKFLGLWKEGDSKMHIKTEKDEVLKWHAASVNPENLVEIVGFSGQMISQNVCIPEKRGFYGEEFWEGKVEHLPGRYSCSITLAINGKKLTFDPYVEVV